LFPALQPQLGPLTDKQEQLVSVLNMVQIEAMVIPWSGGVCRFSQPMFRRLSNLWTYAWG
jgi:hypothetical protein